jgi:hypothetical protein
VWPPVIKFRTATGTDWLGVQQSLREAANYLASLKQRAAMSISEAVADEQSEPNTEIRGEYDRLSGSFAEACRKADAERRPTRSRPAVDRLPTCTCDTINWLLRRLGGQLLFGDSDQAKPFISDPLHWNLAGSCRAVGTASRQPVKAFRKRHEWHCPLLFAAHLVNSIRFRGPY